MERAEEGAKYCEDQRRRRIEASEGGVASKCQRKMGKSVVHVTWTLCPGPFLPMEERPWLLGWEWRCIVE